MEPSPAPGHHPPRVVLDTNILLALWIFADDSVALLRAALAAGELMPVRSVATDAELAEVLARPGLFAVPEERQASLLAAWRSDALLIEQVATAPCRCRDPLDQKFVDLALTVGARLLITRDKALLKLNRKVRSTGLIIATPERCAGVLASRGVHGVQVVTS